LCEISEEDANLGNTRIYENITYVVFRRLEGLFGLCVASDGKTLKEIPGNHNNFINNNNNSNFGTNFVG